MKFGKTLLKSQVPEWSWNYINYKNLKKNVTQIVAAQRQNKNMQAVEDLVTAFFFALDRELEKVNSFYLYKKGELERRLRILLEKYQTVQATPIVVSSTPNTPPTTLTTMPGSDTTVENALLSSLYDTKDGIYKILRFGELNMNGFRKILKKFDKKVHRQTQEIYLKKVSVLPFANSSVLNDALETIEQTIAGVGKRIEEYSKAQPAPSAPGFPQNRLLISKEQSSQLAGILGGDNVDDLKSFLGTLPFYTSPTTVGKSAGVGIFLSDSDAARTAEKGSSVLDSIRFLTNTLYKSCKVGALKCVQFLIAQGADVSGTSDVDERSFLHKLVLSGGNVEYIHKLAGLAHTLNRFSVNPSMFIQTAPISPSGHELADNPDFIRDLVSSCPAIRSLLLHTDLYGRLPLHYAALNGFSKITHTLVDLRSQLMPGGSYGLAWVDHEGYSPVFYAVFRGFTDVLQILMSIEPNIMVDQLFQPGLDVPVAARERRGSIGSSAIVLSSVRSPTLSLSSPYTSGGTCSTKPITLRETPLAIACKLGHVELTKFLIAHAANVDFMDDDGDTPLHMAARNGHSICAEILIAPEKYIQKEMFKCEPKKAQLEIKETINGWTPLFVAVVEGNLKIVRMLLDAGAVANITDLNEWTPHEHAVFRGHMEIAQILKPLTTIKSVNGTSTPSTVSPIGSSPISPEGTSALMNPDRSYGHNYLKDRCMISAILGSNDTRVKTPSVELFEEKIPSYPSLSLVVSARNAIGEAVVLDLPLPDVSEPILFHTLDGKTSVEDSIIHFDLIPTFGSDKTILGRGSCLLSSFTRNKRLSEQGVQVSIPLLSKSFELTAVIHFELLCVVPFTHSNLSIGSKQTYWKSVETKVIGHRGSGANRSGTGNLQIGENTVLSFVTAASLGAEYVEFDVQLTKDNIPVIYHDWVISETGLKIAVNDVTLEEFRALGPRATIQNDFGNISASASRSLRRSLSKQKKPAVAGSSMSTDVVSAVEDKFKYSDDDFYVDYTLKKMSKDINHLHTSGRMKHLGGRADISIKAPFATLEELFHKVPKSTGFNIEVKYPNLMEVGDNALKAPDLNLMIDQILKCVYDNAGDRSIIFSSFHPEACLLLNLKQPNYPVFFLTEGGVEKTFDMRCNSLQEAVRFAKFADLLGIVTLSNPLIEAPHLCKAIKENGLLLFSYGALNNDVKSFAIQRKFGVDAVIVDKILPIVGSLKPSPPP